MEIWNKINNTHQISNRGRVKSNRGLLKPYNNGGGYLKVDIDGKSHYVHRLVATAFISNTNNHPQVNHIDEDKSNNTVDNSGRYGLNLTRITKTNIASNVVSNSTTTGIFGSLNEFCNILNNITDSYSMSSIVSCNVENNIVN